jgi:hypothetical protein
VGEQSHEKTVIAKINVIPHLMRDPGFVRKKTNIKFKSKYRFLRD